MSSVLRIMVMVILSAVALALPRPSDAQVRVTVAVPAPVFELQVGGPLFYVGSGLWVLPDSDDEVFYSRGWYWARHGDNWHRSRGRSGGWHAVGPRYVPASLVRLERGRYQRWHAPPEGRHMAPRGWEQRHPRPVMGPGPHDKPHGKMAPPQGKGKKMQRQPPHGGQWIAPQQAPKYAGPGNSKGQKGGKGKGHGRGR